MKSNVWGGTIAFAAWMAAGAATALAQNCDLSGYAPQDGLKAEQRSGTLVVTWQGERSDQLRAAFTIRDGQPMVHELAALKGNGNWIVLARDVVPEFEVTTGKRRLSEQQMQPLRELGTELTPEPGRSGKVERVLGLAAHGSGTPRHQHGSAAQAG